MKILQLIRNSSLLVVLFTLTACDGTSISEDTFFQEPGAEDTPPDSPTTDSPPTVIPVDPDQAPDPSPDIDPDIDPDSCEARVEPSSINANWMAGKWGLSIRIPGGHESYSGSKVDGFDVKAAVDVISGIAGVSWVQINITNGAFGDKAIAPVPVLEDVNPLAAPQRDLFGEIASALQIKGIKVVAYIASQGPAMLKHGAEKAMDFDESIVGLNEVGDSAACTASAPTINDDQNTTFCSASMNRWRDKMYVLYPDTNETLYRKFEKAMAEHIVEDFSIRYGSLIDGWWFDHTIAGDAALLREAALAGNSNATIALNEGEKVPLTNTLPGLANYTFGHPNPVKSTVPQDNANEPMVTSIEAAPNGILYGPDCEPSLGHIFMPMQEDWHVSTEVVFSETKASEWTNRVLNAGGAITWAISQQGTAGDGYDPLVLSEPQAKLLRRIQSNINTGKRFPLDYSSDEGITARDVNFLYRASRRANVAIFNDDADIITLDNFYGANGTTPRAISGWFRTTDENGTLVKWGTANPNEQWWLKIVDGKLKLEFHGSNVTGSSTVNDNAWKHFAVVAPTEFNTQVELYINGVLETKTTTGTSFNTQAGNEVEIGGSYIGLIDDFRFYERSINQLEIDYLASDESSIDLELALNLKFDESSWRDGLIDSSVYVRQGDISNKTILGHTDDTRGTVATFNSSGLDANGPDEAGDEVRMSDYNGVPGEEPRSVSAWIKTDQNAGVIVQWGSTDQNNGENWIIRLVDGKLQLSINGASVDGSKALNDGNWHHISVVAPDNDLVNTKLYTDGEEEQTTLSGTSTIFDTNTVDNEATDVVIGTGFTGSIDELSIYQRALSQAEISSLVEGL